MLINFPYIKRDTPIHRLDPRAKFLLLLGWGLAAAQTSNFWFMLVGFTGAAWYYSLARLKWSETRRVWYFIIFLNFMLIFVNYFLSGGAIVQGVDMTHPHMLFTLPFIGLKHTAPFIGPASLPFSVESITFMITQGLRNHEGDALDAKGQRGGTDEGCGMLEADEGQRKEHVGMRHIDSL